MKRLSVLLILLIVAINLDAQVVPRLELKPTGFVSAVDSTKNFVVLEVLKMSKVDLYKKSLTYLNSIYKNPSKVISTVEGESITVNGYDNSISLTGNLYNYPYEYNIVLQFKDGKIKFEPRVSNLKEVFTVNNQETPYYVNSDNSSNPDEIHCIYIHNKVKGNTFLFNDKLKIALDKWINNYLAGVNKSLTDKW